MCAFGPAADKDFIRIKSKNCNGVVKKANCFTTLKTRDHSCISRKFPFNFQQAILYQEGFFKAGLLGNGGAAKIVVVNSVPVRNSGEEIVPAYRYFAARLIERMRAITNEIKARSGRLWHTVFHHLIPF